MRINVCVNGSFRYPQYIRHYVARGELGAFYYAHRRSTTAGSMGLSASAGRNGWAKEYALQASARMPARLARHAEVPLCDLWQRWVVRHWRDCDAVEAVIGAVADRLLAHAKARGCHILGHPVCAHHESVAALVGRACEDLGLDPARCVPVAPERRRAEIGLCDHLLVDSRFAARSFAAAGIAPERITVVRPGVDLERFHPRRPEERDTRIFRVVCVATITPRKAQHLLLRAWKRLNLPRAELTLVGPFGRDAQAVIRGFEDSFVHVPRVPNAALRALLVRASAFVLPSVEDGFAQAPLEAMACGVPVIVSENVGMADLVAEGHDGFVVPAFDVDQMAARIEMLYRRPDLAAAMGDAAAAAAGRQGSWRAYADRVLALHRAMAGRAPYDREAA